MSNEQQVFPCKYPKEIFDAKTSTKTLSVTANFFEASVKNPVSDPKKVQKPYYIYAEPFSRLVVAIMSKENGSYGSVSANIPVNDIAALFEDARAARNADILLHTGQAQKTVSLLSMIIGMLKNIQKALKIIFNFMKNGPSPAAQKPSGDTAEKARKEDLKSKASSVTMTMGVFKGKTPFGFISEKQGNPAEMKQQADQLRKQPDFLRKNLDKYPANQDQIDAIEAALAYYDAGYFNGEDTVADTSPQDSSEEIVLLKAEPKPNTYKRDPKTGLCPVYEISVKYLIGYRSPIQFTIVTYDAPVDTKQTGAINVKQAQAQNKKTAQFNLRWVEFANLMRRVEAHMRRFEALCAEKQFAEAAKADKENQEAARKEKEAQAHAQHEQPLPQPGYGQPPYQQMPVQAAPPQWQQPQPPYQQMQMQMMQMPGQTAPPQWQQNQYQQPYQQGGQPVQQTLNQG